MSQFVFGTHNAAFVQVMYEQYLRDPAGVSEEWRLLFDNGQLAELPVIPATRGEVSATQGTGASQSTEQGAGRDAAVSSDAPLKPAAEAPAPRSPLSASPAPTDGAALTPLTGAAARLARNMEASLSVPTATSFREVAMADLEAHRRALNGALAGSGIKISFTHLIGYAIVQAARAVPVMTHAFRAVDGKPHLVTTDEVNLGLAVDVEKKDGTRGLMVPVIKGGEAMDFAAFRQNYEALVDKARNNRLLPDDLAGATLTLTNPGTIGTVASVPRLMEGQGTIVATGAIRETGAARVMTISSTYDHRVIQGAESGLFLGRIDDLLQGEDGFYEEVFQSMGASYVVPREPAPAVVPAGAPATAMARHEDLAHVAAAMALVRAFRNFGFRAARLDPLGREPAGDPALDPTRLALTPEIMARVPADVLRISVPGRTLAEALPHLQAVYCGSLSYEVEHVASHEERVWLRQIIESGEHRRPLAPEERKALLGRLAAIEALEQFLHKAYIGQKRFSIEGLDALVPMLDLTLELAGEEGAEDIVIGMAHRGRLNVLAHIVGLPYETIFAEFEGGRRVEETNAPLGGTGDVKYHHGAEGSFLAARGQRVKVTLAPNPSHLEAVNSVIEGRARASQTDRSAPEPSHHPTRALPVLIHGDAAFAAQGVVPETFNLARLRGYSTGGTIHFITDNQIGFTTEPGDARSTDHASDLAKGFEVPIVHINADDPEACLAAVRLAMAYRAKFASDVVVHLVGYRRFGHNEGDEPAYTQPRMYHRIQQTPPVRRRYAETLARDGVLTLEEAEQQYDAAYKRLADLQQGLKASLQKSGGEEPRRIVRGEAPPEPETAVPAERLRDLNDQLLTVPDGFTIHPKLAKQLERRRVAMGAQGGIEWAHAEALAFASLLVEGTPIRLTGQDTERGTFSQRHLALYDAEDGRRWAPIERLHGAPVPLELHNSPLSELACLGFEYGYATQAPDVLVLWEAQFGDFANGAEIIIDQFIIAGLAKWGLTSRLTMLLPHGYEGQGPEHSSARLERYLALGAEGNIRVANCTTPAQYFHLLRRQALHTEIRPLVVMTPKGLLRLPAATSHLDELASGGFAAVLDDADAATRRDAVTRLMLCSGRVYYDLLASDARATKKHVAIGRVELLYPFPAEELRSLIGRYPNLAEVVWTQEEPRNMGARKFFLPKLRDQVLPSGVVAQDVSRPERSSPAEGYPAAHREEQNRIVKEAYG